MTVASYLLIHRTAKALRDCDVAFAEVIKNVHKWIHFVTSFQLKLSKEIIREKRK